MKNEIKRWNKSRVSYIHFGCGDFYDFDSFVLKLLENLKDNVRYSLLLKLNFNKDRYCMVGKQIGFKYLKDDYIDDFDNLHSVYKRLIDTNLDNYDVEYISSIQLLYVLVSDMPQLKIKNVNKIHFNSNFTNVKDNKKRFNFIPLTIDTHYFGKSIMNKDDCTLLLNKINKQRNILNMDELVIDDSHIIHLYDNSMIIISVIQSDTSYYRAIYDLKTGALINELVDTIISENHFTRKIGNTSLTIVDSTIVKVESAKALSAIRFSPKTLKDEANPFIGSWDVEAFEDADGYAKVYALGFAVLNQESQMFYLDDGISSEDLVLKCINAMLISKYNGYTFYTHNFGKYDSIFLIKILKEANIKLGYDHYVTKELDRDGKVLKLNIKIKRVLVNSDSKGDSVKKESGYVSITIVDSLNILNQSLSALCGSFQVPVTKGNFPYSFVKRDTLHYVGNTPDYKYWENISLEDYNSFKKSDWSLKDECLKYLDKDLVSLVMIMSKFSEYINRKYHLQVTESLTISRLALNIFLKDYLGDAKLPIINKNIFSDIKQAYYGGVTEVYKPYGTNLLHYDVNSLYPFAALNPMPGVNCTFIENMGKSLDLHDLFGFFYCEIKSNDSYIGLLPVHSKEGMIMPHGSWKGWYFSEELKYAAENGYTINVIKGYNFDKVKDVFTSYVNDLYKIKSSTNDVVEKDIAKRLLNHLLGRFGLNINKPITKCVDGEGLSLLFSTREIIGIPIKITDDDYRVTYNSQIDPDICAEHDLDYIKVQNLTPKTDVENLNEFKDVSLTTAAAVTAYARIYMSKIKKDILDKSGNIYYTDTDSIVTDIPLDDNLIGNELGRFKLEYKIKQGYYISNKTYYIDLVEALWDKHSKKYISSIVKSKAVKNESLSLDSFKDLYNNKNVEAIKRSAIKDHYKGSVLISDEAVQLKHNAYTKREKVYKGDKWVDTKPLVLDSNSYTIKKGNIKDNKKKDSSVLVTYLFSKVIDFTVVTGATLFSMIMFILLQMDIFDILCGDSIHSDIDPNLNEKIEWRYNDDYMEEPIEVDIYIHDKKGSKVKDFINLFMDRNYKQCSLYRDNTNLTNYSCVNIVSSESLYNVERPKVLSSVLVYQINSLADELTDLKNYYTSTEMERLDTDVKINDALKLCSRAIRGIPHTGVNSPLLDTYFSNESSPHIGGQSSSVMHNTLSNSITSSPQVGSSSPLTRSASPFIERRIYNIVGDRLYHPVAGTRVFDDTQFHSSSSPVVDNHSSITGHSFIVNRGLFGDRSYNTIVGRGLFASSPLTGPSSPVNGSNTPLS